MLGLNMQDSLNNNQTAQIEDGYGEFVVINPLEKVTKETHDAAYQIFLQYRDEMNRTEHIHRDLQKIDTNLKAVFVPRTLYELTFFKDLIENAPNVVRRYARHVLPCFKDYGDNDNVKIKEIAFSINGVFEDIFQKRSEKSNISAFTQGDISELLEDSILFLAEKIHTKEYEDRACGSIIGNSLQSPTQTMVSTERHKQILRDMTALECSQVAKEAFIICRGANFSSDSILYNSSWNALSFGTSLFAGIEYDTTATAFHYMVSVKKEKNDAYAIIVPKSDLITCPFRIPRTHALCQLGGVGEAFHARANVHETNPDTQNQMSLQELENSYRKYKSTATLLAPLPNSN